MEEPLRNFRLIAVAAAMALAVGAFWAPTSAKAQSLAVAENFGLYIGDDGVGIIIGDIGRKRRYYDDDYYYYDDDYYDRPRRRYRKHKHGKRFWRRKFRGWRKHRRWHRKGIRHWH